MMPRLDGIEVCRRLRSRSQVPIIMLTARDDEVDKVLGLEIGADDYITKPFSVREFRSRVKAALRRTRMSGDEPAEGPIRAGELGVDPARASGDDPRRAGPAHLRRVRDARGAGPQPRPRLRPREALLERIWGDSTYRDPRTIDVHIRHLREKIETEPKQPEYLLTVRGVGYRFRDEDVS